MTCHTTWTSSIRQTSMISTTPNRYMRVMGVKVCAQQRTYSHLPAVTDPEIREVQNTMYLGAG